MYDDFIARLRSCSYSDPNGCDACSYCPNRTNYYECKQKLALQAADAIEELSKPHWIPVTERLPEAGVDVLVKFPQNMAVASIDIGEWVVNSGDGWCTDINLAVGEKNPTHWMPLPQPPKED